MPRLPLHFLAQSVVQVCVEEVGVFGLSSSVIQGCTTSTSAVSDREFSLEANVLLKLIELFSPKHGVRF